MTKQMKRVVSPNNYDAKRQAAFAKLRADRIKAAKQAQESKGVEVNAALEQTIAEVVEAPAKVA
jgi:hypothetical protein